MPTYADPGVLTFEAPIRRYDGGGSFVTVPTDVHAAFGAKGRVPVLATYDGADYRGSIVPYNGEPMLVVPLALQADLGKGAGDLVQVTVRLDTAERVVELDSPTEDALRTAGLLDRFRAMSYSHQREYWQWIDSAKRAETREARIARTLELVAEGKRLK